MVMLPAKNFASIQKSIAASTNMEGVYEEVSRLRQLTAPVPAQMKQDPALQKAWRSMPSGQPARGPKSIFFDPLSIQYALGYKDRRYSLTYDTLKRVTGQLSIIGAIINTRIAQVASFCQPYRTTKSLGYVIRHKDPEHMTTNSEKRFIKYLEMFIASCGDPSRNNHHVRYERDDFEQFLKKIVRDTLTYDQIGFEIVPRNNGVPFEFWAVDGHTLRLASPDRDIDVQFSYHGRNTPGRMAPYRYQGLYSSPYGLSNKYPAGAPTQYIQLVNGQIENTYTSQELAFGIRNPRTDIYIQGYGYGEIEQLITIVTGLLYAEEYNRRYFTQGAHPKGILNFKGDNWTPDQLEAFRRQWVAQVAGTENAWKTPITQSEGIEWVNLQMTNRDMEFNSWIEYLIKITCGVFLIDPAEINFDLHGGVQQTPLFESSQEWKLKASRDRGLKPLLRFIAKLINRHIIDRIDDHFVFEFVGLDELTEQEKHEMLKEQIASYMTLNEGRRSLDLPDVELGDIPMNPTYVQAAQMVQQQQQQEQQMAQQQEEQAQQQAMAEQQAQQAQQPPPQQPGVPGPGGTPPESPPPQAPPEQQEEPESQYTANFGKSLADRDIVITFDDFIDQQRSK